MMGKWSFEYRASAATAYRLVFLPTLSPPHGATSILRQSSGRVSHPIFPRTLLGAVMHQWWSWCAAGDSLKMLPLTWEKRRFVCQPRG